MDRGRFGMHHGVQFSPTEAVSWAAENDMRHVDVCLDMGSLDSSEYEGTSSELLRSTCEDEGISLGLHTLSAVNVAEFSPFTSDAVDEYLKAYIDIAAALSADRVIVHAGYHFTADEDTRREASVNRLDRLLSYAETRDVNLLLENMNPEPDDAEVHYLCSTLEDCKRYFDELESPNLKWAFNPAHAHLADAGIDAFVSDLGLEQCQEVRLNDNRGVREEHLLPGEGTIDFKSLFTQLKGCGYNGPYTIALGSIEEMFDGIDRLLEAALE